MLYHCARDARDAPTGLLRHHLRHGKLGDVDLTLQIRFRQQFEIMGCVVRKRFLEEDACIVDHTVY
jgi:hypothetical protein